MNFRLFLMKGLHPAHRAVFMTGVMAYLSAPLWFLFLVLSTVQLALHTLVPPEYFTEPFQLFPIWPQWRPEWALSLAGGTALLLFLPKILSVLLVPLRAVRKYGGEAKLVASVAGEILASALLAPIRMLFHTRFVVTALLGRSVGWKSPSREDAATTWGEAIRRHGLQTAFGMAWIGLVYWLDPAFVWWLAPVAGALVLSIPMSVYTSRASLGERARRAGLFLIPEETSPPPEIAAMQRYARSAPPAATWTDAVVDTACNAMMAAFAAPRPLLPPAVREARRGLVERALSGGPDALTGFEKNTLLSDRDALRDLHRRVVSLDAVHPEWVAARAGAQESAPM
jgi:membrane glycosyltransferase